MGFNSGFKGLITQNNGEVKLIRRSTTESVDGAILR